MISDYGLQGKIKMNLINGPHHGLYGPPHGYPHGPFHGGGAKEQMQAKLSNEKNQTWNMFEHLFNNIKVQLGKNNYEIYKQDEDSINHLINRLKAYETQLYNIFIKIVSYVPDQTNNDKELTYKMMEDQYEQNHNKITDKHKQLITVLQELAKLNN
jgi:hypothetical protein